MIHPTAIVHPEARLAPDVEIGPFAIVDAEVEIGAGSRVLARAHLTGDLRIGEDCEIHMGAIVGHLPQDLSFRKDTPTRTVVGDRTVIRENATVHRATVPDTATVIGADCYLMAQSHVAHDCVLGDRVILCNNALAAGHVRIGDRAFVSGNTVIHQFCRVGALCMVSGISGTSLDVPPYLVVSGRSEVRGLNVVGMRRAGLDAEARQAVKDAYRGIARCHGNLEAALAVLDAAPALPAIDEIRRFYAETSRKGLAWPTF